MCEFIREQRQTPVAGRYDVIVVGGGPGGLPAAIAALNSGTNRILAAQAADEMLNISGITASFVLRWLQAEPEKRRFWWSNMVFLAACGQQVW